MSEWSLPDGVGPQPDTRPTRHVELPARPRAILSPATRRRVWRGQMGERCWHKEGGPWFWFFVIVVLVLLTASLITTCAHAPPR